MNLGSRQVPPRIYSIYPPGIERECPEKCAGVRNGRTTPDQRQHLPERVRNAFPLASSSSDFRTAPFPTTRVASVRSAKARNTSLAAKTKPELNSPFSRPGYPGRIQPEPRGWWLFSFPALPPGCAYPVGPSPSSPKFTTSAREPGRRPDVPRLSGGLFARGRPQHRPELSTSFLMYAALSSPPRQLEALHQVPRRQPEADPARRASPAIRKQIPPGVLAPPTGSTSPSPTSSTGSRSRPEC